ncbi:MAG TPA: HAMP domain-containing sensor histidine kinase [Beutenbergiaceae bacterium]|nr:HAMP domain-containing sensor histidine kinase [Beutenbergiaceae bacterium]
MTTTMMTMTTTSTMTRRSAASARTRILAWIMVIVTLAAVVIVGATARVMFARVEARANIELAHEAEKLHDFAERPDPTTGEAYREVAELLSAHLQHNLPEHDETLFSLLDGEPHRRSVAEPPARLDRNPAFVARAAEAREPVAGTWETSAGVVAYAVIPVEVSGDPSPGHLVVVEFLAQDFEEARRLLWMMAIIAAVALAVAGVTGWFTAGRVLAPIRELQRTAAVISETDLDRRIDVVGNDDVAGLARTFNGMLDRLARAFEGQRQFLDDAGHELRTPITIIRGHLEVMGEDPQEQRATLTLVNDELHRMGRLIDDLIMLARSERPDFVRVSPTNLTELVVETFAKATGLADRQWSLDETPDADALVDPERLTQALLQLAANAVAHTKEGMAIAFGGRVAGSGEGRKIYLWVRDEGSGIAREDQHRIFERFVRSGPEKSRERNSGLGLAIVRRIAQAHGGEVTVDSSPGRGATFTLVLPVREEE